MPGSTTTIDVYKPDAVFKIPGSIIKSCSTFVDGKLTLKILNPETNKFIRYKDVVMKEFVSRAGLKSENFLAIGQKDKTKYGVIVCCRTHDYSRTHLRCLLKDIDGSDLVLTMTALCVCECITQSRYLKKFLDSIQMSRREYMQKEEEEKIEIDKTLKEDESEAEIKEKSTKTGKETTSTTDMMKFAAGIKTESSPRKTLKPPNSYDNFMSSEVQASLVQLPWLIFQVKEVILPYMSRDRNHREETTNSINDLTIRVSHMEDFLRVYAARNQSTDNPINVDDLFDAAVGGVSENSAMRMKEESHSNEIANLKAQLDQLKNKIKENDDAAKKEVKALEEKIMKLEVLRQTFNEQYDALLKE